MRLPMTHVLMCARLCGAAPARRPSCVALAISEAVRGVRPPLHAKYSRRLFSVSPSSNPRPAARPGLAAGAMFASALVALQYAHASGTLQSWSAYRAFVDAIVGLLRANLDAEDAHKAAITALRWGLAPTDAACVTGDAPILHTSVCGMSFSNPIGLAAGFDKHAEAVEQLQRVGFGFVEIGTVTPLPQAGNPRPRVFRLSADRAVINRYGFNSEGLNAVMKRVTEYRFRFPSTPASSASSHSRSSPVGGPVGVNIGKNKEGDALADFTAGATAAAPVADYIVVNVSSPNTPGLRALQSRQALQALLEGVKSSVHRSSNGRAPPVWVKIAPDLMDNELRDIAAVVDAVGIDGVIVSNTTISRPASLMSAPELVGQTGGLSGAPLMHMSTLVLARMYALTGGRVPLIGVGGVSSGADAYVKIRAGASLVQVYTAFTYGDSDFVPRVKRELAELLQRDGFACVADAVGADHKTANRT